MQQTGQVCASANLRYLEINSSSLADLVRSRIFSAGSPRISSQRQAVYIGVFKEHQEPDVVQAFMEEGFDEVHVSTGYLNFPDRYLGMFRGAEMSLYASCPDENAFGTFGAAGRLVGPVYSYSFLHTLECLPKLEIREFVREGYTFHVKGKCCN